MSGVTSNEVYDTYSAELSWELLCTAAARHKSLKERRFSEEKPLDPAETDRWITALSPLIRPTSTLNEAAVAVTWSAVSHGYEWL